MQVTKKVTEKLIARVSSIVLRNLIVWTMLNRFGTKHQHVYAVRFRNGKSIMKGTKSTI